MSSSAMNHHVEMINPDVIINDDWEEQATIQGPSRIQVEEPTNLLGDLPGEVRVKLYKQLKSEDNSEIVDIDYDYYTSSPPTASPENSIIRLMHASRFFYFEIAWFLSQTARFSFMANTIDGSVNHGHCINRVALQWFERGRDLANGVDAHVRNLEIGSYHPIEVWWEVRVNDLRKVSVRLRRPAEARRRANLVNVSRDETSRCTTAAIRGALKRRLAKNATGGIGIEEMEAIRVVLAKYLPGVAPAL